MRSNRKEVQKNYHFVTVGGISLVESVSHNSGNVISESMDRVIYRDNLGTA